MKKIGVMSFTVSAALLTPMLTFAAATFDPNNSFKTYIGSITSFMNGVLVPLIFAVALLVFMYGMFKYFILGGSDEDSQKEGKQLMIWAVVGFVAMISIFGVVNLVANGLGFANQSVTGSIPTLPSAR